MNCAFKYPKSEKIELPDRVWPTKQLEKAPIWCSVDLRDGNQALINPMSVSEKVEFFKLLCKLGFKEIEVGFPSASQTEFEFIRKLIEDNLIPEDVTIQVICQCREHLLDRTFEAVKGAKKVIFHLYVSTSSLQREVVFEKSKEEMIAMTIEGTKQIRKFKEEFEGELILEYSPESFTGTELEFARDICNAVIETWDPGKDEKIIINLPETVEMTTPNIYADRIEWMGRNLNRRENLILSLHTHNDRGSGAAASELGILAGAQRVEGTLFGNGERTGNADILTIAYNLLSEGIDPLLNLDNIPEIIDVYERLTRMTVDDRHPYAGKLVFTAFSGSHQDAISKGIRAMSGRGDGIWRVPYLPIDPKDIGRAYETLVRINAQSGKGGIGFIMETEFGYKLPKGMVKEFSKIIQNIAETKGGEIQSEVIMEEFREQYLGKKYPYHFLKLQTNETHVEDDTIITSIELKFDYKNEEKNLVASGNGPLDAAMSAMRKQVGRNFKILDFTEHALGLGSTAQAAAYIHMLDADNGEITYGVGVSSNITRASIRAMFSAINRLLERR
ncbi:MAG: 2-isopropylmalate synthase [Lachnospiraceae bacterium]|nr:2-isopropylmalate synthase [Lachnospiraceae bacterium]